jgi:hypothetical protein
VTRRLKAGVVLPEEMAIAKQRLGKHVLAVTNIKKLKSVACSPQANYTDRAAAAC